MSIVVRDMEMPDKCGDCAIYVCYRTWNGDPGDEFCGVIKESVSYKTKPDWCPLSEIPERKKGKWITQNHNIVNGMVSTTVYYYPKCSVCGHCANYTNFCPACGSDMRGNPDD